MFLRNAMQGEAARVTSDASAAKAQIKLVSFSLLSQLFVII
jgi:hypothetical protein